MTEVTLKDIGYYNVSRTQGTSGEEKAYGTVGTEGGALDLHAISIGVKFKCFTNKTPSPQVKKNDVATARFELGEVDTNGIDFPVWTIKGSFSTLIETHMKEYGRLCHMSKTKGFKQLGFVHGSRWDANGNSLLNDQADIINYSHYGEREKDGAATKTVDYVNVRIESFDVDQIIKDGTKITYTLELVGTDPWTANPT